MFFTILSLSSVAADYQDVILERIKKDFVSSPTTLSKDIKLWSDTLRAKSRWDDIDYANVNSPGFAPIVALIRASAFARAHGAKAHPLYQSATIRNQALRVLREWLTRDYQSYNWWYNTIGVQIAIMPIIAAFRSSLTAEDMNKLRVVLDRSSILKGYSGQNQIWYSDIVLFRGLIFNIPEDVEGAIKEIKKSIQISNSQGIREDYSFFQHGPLIYNGGYGQAYSQIMTKYFFLLSGTPYEFSKEQYNLFDAYSLEGLRLFTRGKYIDIGVTGREFTRAGVNIDRIKVAAEYMIKAKSPRSKEYQSWRDSIQNNTQNNLSLNKMFYIGDMMVHHRPEFYSSARMVSTRTQNTDFPSNSEGLLSHNIADGLHLFSKDFEEYKDIYPVWDWSRLPGTTSHAIPIIPTKFIPGVESGKNQVSMGKTAFVGGASTGTYGVSGFEFKKPLVNYNLTAKKSWHFFDDGVVALGSGINCPNCSKEVITTLDQLIADDRDTPSILFSQNYYAVSGPDVVVKGKRFVSLDSTEIEVRTTTKEGSWSKINGGGSKELFSKLVTDISVNHGIRPVNAGYAYVIAPHYLNSGLFKQNIEFINNEEIHSVWFTKEKRLSAVFYKVADLAFGEYRIEVSRPCILILEKLNPSSWKLSVSEPTQTQTDLVITLKQNNITKAVSLKLGGNSKNGKTLFTTIQF